MKVALITGASSGIGLALAERLIQSHANIHLCLACRSKLKAESARKLLLTSLPEANISVVLVDVSNLGSIYKAVDEIRSRYHHLDFLFLNAGIMPDTTVDWSNFFRQLLSVKCIHMFATGEGLLQQQDQTTTEGLRQIFVTNVFGHFVLVKELEGILGGCDGTTQIIWTSSSNAKKDAFSLNDIQHRYGQEAYSSSKYASDLVSYAMNEQLNSKSHLVTDGNDALLRGIYSHVTCPGLVLTNLTYGILPWWIWLMLIPILWLLRIVIPSVTVTPKNGCEALFWLTRQEPQSLDPMMKFHSKVSLCGQRYVTAKQMDIDPEFARNTYDRLSRLEMECGLMFKKT